MNRTDLCRKMTNMGQQILAAFLRVVHEASVRGRRVRSALLSFIAIRHSLLVA